jgi:hypothetical protein
MAESEFFPEISNLSENEKRAFWLLGIIPSNIGYIGNMFIQSAVFCINYLIWRVKLSKTKTPVSIFREDFVFMCKLPFIEIWETKGGKNKFTFFLCRQNF